MWLAGEEQLGLLPSSGGGLGLRGQWERASVYLSAAR